MEDSGLADSKIVDGAMELKVFAVYLSKVDIITERARSGA
jgi:hypothetical protein